MLAHEQAQLMVLMLWYSRKDLALGRLKTKNSSSVRWKRVPESITLTKMGTHGFRAPKKTAVNLEAQRNPLQIKDYRSDSLASL